MVSACSWLPFLAECGWETAWELGLDLPSELPEQRRVLPCMWALTLARNNEWTGAQCIRGLEDACCPALGEARSCPEGDLCCVGWLVGRGGIRDPSGYFSIGCPNVPTPALRS